MSFWRLCALVVIAAAAFMAVERGYLPHPLTVARAAAISIEETVADRLGPLSSPR